MACQHEVVLVNRSTKKVVCHACLAELEYSCLAGEEGRPSVAAAESPRCIHSILQTHPVTGVTRCLYCNETVVGQLDTTPTFKGEESFASAADAMGYSYKEAFSGEAMESWDPAGSKPCPHFIKTTNMSTGKVSCCMCHTDLA